MYYAQPFTSADVHYVCFTDPFSESDILAAMQDSAEGRFEGVTDTTPAIVDLSSLTKMWVSPAAVQRLAVRRRAMDGRHPTRVVACLAPDLRALLSLRLFAAASHMVGLRDEIDFFATQRPSDAVQWIAQRAGLDPKQTAAFRIELADLMTKVPKNAA